MDRVWGTRAFYLQLRLRRYYMFRRLLQIRTSPVKNFSSGNRRETCYGIKEIYGRLCKKILYLLFGVLHNLKCDQCDFYVDPVVTISCVDGLLLFDRLQESF
jgi:hypothetical protein